MSRIRQIKVDESSGLLKRLLEGAIERSERVWNISQVMSINPEPFVQPTLFQYMSARGGPNWKKTMLLEVTGHYVVVNRDTVADNRTPLGCHYSKYRWKKMRVREAWLVTSM